MCASLSAVLTPTARLLELIELLQAQTLTTGGQIAERLEIDPRTVRRYIAALQELGIPIEGQRGVGGGYRMRPGFRLPPLMLNDGEAVVVVLGLIAAQQLGLDTTTHSADGALEKIRRVLPTKLRRQAEALEDALGFTSAPTAGVPVAGEAVLLLADAIRRRRRLRAAYTSFSGENTQREISPHGLVVHSGRWYLAGHDHTRSAMRVFRVDRLRETTATDDPALEPPDGFRAVAHVSRSLARVPWKWHIEVLLDLPVDQAATRLPATLAEILEADRGTLLRMRVSSLDWMARVLAGLNCGFTILEPEELRAKVEELADRLAASARQT